MISFISQNAFWHLKRKQFSFELNLVQNSSFVAPVVRYYSTDLLKLNFYCTSWKCVELMTFALAVKCQSCFGDKAFKLATRKLCQARS